MAGASKQLSYTLLPSRHSVCSAIVQRRDSRSCTSVPCQRTEAKYRISDIFLERHVGNIFGFSSVQRSQYFILPMSYRGQEVWLLAWLDVTTSIRDRDTNLGPWLAPPCGGLIKDRRGSNWPKSWPVSSRSRTQLPPAYVAIVQLSKVASIPSF